MRILFINPNNKKDINVIEDPLIVPPINLMYLAEILNREGHYSEIIDAYINELKVSEVLKFISKFEPDCIGIPVYSQSLDVIFKLTNAIKNKFSQMVIFAGGPHAAVLPDKTFEQFPSIDIIVRGEGEIIIKNLINAIEKNKSLKDIKGISFRDTKNNKRIIHNKDEKIILDLDSIPIPSRNLVDYSKYYSKLSKSNYSDVIITSRGCPFRCTFCDKQSKASRIYRERSPENVMEELRIIAERKMKAVEIFDDLFTFNQKRCIKILKMIKKERLDFEFRIRTRVNAIGDELLYHLKKGGCSTASYGVESGNQKILDLNKKGITIKMVEQAFKKTKKVSINILGFFMIALPGDTPDTINQTIRFAKKLDPHYAAFAKLIPLPGTEVYINAKKNGTLVGDFGPGKQTPWVKLPWTKTELDINKYVKKAYRSFYFRPNYIYKLFVKNLKEKNWNQLSYLAKNFYKPIVYQQEIKK